MTDGAAVLDSREPDETMELADALDWVRLRGVGRGRSTEVTLSESAALRRFCENVEETERERLQAVSGDGEKALGARERFPTEVDFDNWEGAREVVEYTEGWRSMFVLISRLVRREGASSSSLIRQLS